MTKQKIPMSANFANFETEIADFESRTVNFNNRQAYY